MRNSDKNNWIKKRRSRQDPNAKLTENERDCDRKRQSRQDPGFHANELDKKKDGHDKILVFKQKN